MSKSLNDILEIAAERGRLDPHKTGVENAGKSRGELLDILERIVVVAGDALEADPEPKPRKSRVWKEIVERIVKALQAPDRKAHNRIVDIQLLLEKYNVEV